MTRAIPLRNHDALRERVPPHAHDAERAVLGDHA